MRLGFPDVVDDVTVRLVASVVLGAGVVALATGWWQMYAVLAADFLRASLGPRASPIARVVLQWVRPAVSAAPRPTPGPPKRFAAAIGAVLTTLAAVAGALHSTGGSATAATVVFAIGAIMVVFPALEAAVGLCVGCVLFAGLMRWGVVPERICLECADITQRTATALSGQRGTPATPVNRL
ncbi:MAG: DUF4395 domain-containing protein [Dermatophilaceae bacterium]|nr:DUF4395 domain-containing protein [Dermatophilaceae bacterium]MBP9918852.1 DUF4395 domain-containing protein [Dermatophilaceae bacterium]